MPFTSRRNIWMLDLHDSLDRHKAGSKAKIANVEGNKEVVRGTEGTQSVRGPVCWSRSQQFIRKALQTHWRMLSRRLTCLYMWFKYSLWWLWGRHMWGTKTTAGRIFLYIIFFKFYFIFKLHIIVLVLPNIKMNPPQVLEYSCFTMLC